MVIVSAMIESQIAEFNNEDEKKRMYDWNLTAKTIMSVNEWKNLFKDAVLYAESFKVSPRLNKMLKWAPHIKNDIYA